jgi:hypothetical protein
MRNGKTGLDKSVGLDQLNLLNRITDRGLEMMGVLCFLLSLCLSASVAGRFLNDGILTQLFRGL